MKAIARLVISTCVIAVACGDTSTPTPTASTLTIDSYNVGLAGAFIPFETQRRAAIGGAIAQMPSDIVCIQEAWREEDKDAIVAATRARFPHVARAVHDLASRTTTELPVDSTCTVLPVPTTPPCSSMALRTALDEGLTCLAASCSTMPGNQMGQTTSTACAQAMCIGRIGALITSPEADGLRCYGCLASALPTESFASIRNLCTTNPNAGLAFGGRSGTMILSRYPLSNIDTLVMPGNWNRRVITRATATLPGNRRVAVYCNHLTPVFNNVAFPYTGRYGCTQVGEQGWINEQMSQARRLVSYVGETAGNDPAFILGDFNAGPASTGVVAEAADTYAYLRMQFTPAVPGNYVPVCTFCGTNFLTGGSDSTWIDHIFMRGIPATSVRSFERTFVDTSVTVPTAPGRVSPSDHYGVRAVITL